MQDKEKILKYAHMAVPRYTSYPTAVDFYPISDALRFSALRALCTEDRISAYIHIPYCDAMCNYCGCFTKITRRPEVIADYVHYLIRDIRRQAAHFSGRPRLTHLHWGGGTPSIIAETDFAAIMEALHEAFVFDDHAEHAIELDPRTVDAKLCCFLASQGVNRASLGVQDINPQVQEVIGRIQPLTDIERAVSALRRAGINSINFDLIYGLPLQTEQTLTETCAKTREFSPDRIACYGYAHLPQRRANQRLIKTEFLPDSYERFLQAELVGRAFSAFGYQAVGIDHFALPQDPLAKAARNGKLHRNFQGYTDDDATILLGFGASAISEFSNLYAQTIAGIGQYKKAVEDGGLGTLRGIELTEEDKKRAQLICDLMCRFCVDLDIYGGRQAFIYELKQLQPLFSDNIASLDGAVINITEEGKPFVRIVAALFDTYRQKKQARFSPAI